MSTSFVRELNNIIITEGNLKELKNVYRMLIEDFPADELKEYDHLETLLNKKKYKLLLGKHKILNEMVGYAFIYELDHLNAIWLDYMAIDKKYQNEGYGTLLFHKIAQLKQEGIGLFLEVEIPVENGDTIKEQQKRRINFYERMGAKKLHIDYEFPTNNGGFPMYLYFRPSENTRMLSKKQIKDGIVSAFEYIHSDVKDREIILNRFLASIGDEYLVVESDYQ